MCLRSPLPSSSLIVFFLVLVTLVSTASSQPLYQLCGTSSRNYTANSTYQSNLLSLLSSLEATGPDSGNYANGVGNVPDRVYGVILCRGDVDAGSCGSCLNSAAQEVLKACPYQRYAIIWYDYCLLRYTEEWTFLSISGSSDYIYMWNIQNVTATDLPLFHEQLGKLMSSLATYAAFNSSGCMFATGTAAFSAATPEIYGLVQCTADQPAETCKGCLTGFISEIPRLFVTTNGARILGTTCYFRYELYPFYNTSDRVSIPLSIGTSVPSPAPVLPPSLSPSHPTSKGSRLLTAKWLSVIITVGVVLALVSFTGISICMMKGRKKTQCMWKVSHIESLLFDLPTLREATEGFSNSNKLGEGGFGAVYKGILEDGQIIAVKKLSRSSGQGLEELRNEVKLLSKQEHRNLVRVLGVCLEEEKLLVYEYMPNSSLDNFLFDSAKSKELIWQLRYKIIEGIARGLLYLHEESQYTIIHRDLKASNILLDAKMNPKISDFGISRLFSGDQTHDDTSHVAGTFGYMAPEYVFNGQFSNKLDVFSFGVLVLEIVTGQRNRSFSSSEDYRNLLSHVWEHWTIGDVRELIDPSMGGLYHELEVIKCIQVGLLCVQEAPASRPAMSSVVLMLDGVSMILDVPLQPAFLPRQSEIYNLPKSMHSPNELSISALDPR